MDKVSVLVFLSLAALLFVAAPVFTGNAVLENAVVSRVIDGDTLELMDGEKVRLLGINTPERGQMLYEEAGLRLGELVLEKTVQLEPGQEERDKYGRLLRYVFAGGVNVNLAMVSEGWAFAYMLEPGDKYADMLLSAEQAARETGAGVWNYSGVTDAFCIGLHYPFQYNAEGDDRENLNGEFVTLRNSCTYPVGMAGWRLADASGAEYIFAGFTLSNKSAVTIHTGNGEDTGTNLYWNNSRPVWNNNGDSLYLWNSEDDIVLKYVY